jgi:hypothetical protein
MRHPRPFIDNSEVQPSFDVAAGATPTIIPGRIPDRNAKTLKENSTQEQPIPNLQWMKEVSIWVGKEGQI